MKFAVFGAGCFWCVEAVFRKTNGVNKVISGYTGGNFANPTYLDICTGTTGHAEVCKIIYNPDIVTFEYLLKVFWETHDSTTLNKQGNDIGTQYRSAIFYVDKRQKELATLFKKELNEKKIFDSAIITEIKKLNSFYHAEEYHQDYFKKNPKKSYCEFVIKPKLDKYLKHISKK